MNKIKSFISRNKITFIILAVVLVAVVTLAVIYFSVKPIIPPANDFIPTGAQASSKELEEVSNFIAPNEADIVVDKVVSSASPSSIASSSVTSSKKVSIKVDGNASSKVVSSKPQIKVEGNISKSASSEPTQSKPNPKPPVSSEITPPPPASSEPIEPPFNPDGPQHGEKITDEYGVAYYHVGINAYIPESVWTNCHFGEHPEATDWDVDTMYRYLKDGEQFGNLVWCNTCKDFVKVEYWNDGRHAKAAH